MRCGARWRAYRQAILLTQGKQLSYEEAAHIMGIPANTVASHLKRGREDLRKATEDHSTP